MLDRHIHLHIYIINSVSLNKEKPRSVRLLDDFYSNIYYKTISLGVLIEEGYIIA